MLRRLSGVGRNRYVLAIVTGGLAGAILLLFFLLVRGQRDTIVIQVQPVTDPMMIEVYVGGEVNKPGLYAFRKGSRVADAVSLAGGLLPSADTSSLGMAAVLEDADQIIVAARRPAPQSIVQATPVGTPLPVVADTTAPPNPPTQPPPDDSGPVDINTASVDELDRLPGIGPVIAARVIEYRLANGPFQTLEELDAVEGISERMVDELRPLIILGP